MVNHICFILYGQSYMTYHMLAGPRNSELARAQKRARERLYRHGFHKKRRCTVLDHAKLILVRDPAERRQSLFASLIYNDLMHWELNVCDYGFAAIVGVMTNEMKVECDRNTRALPMFRNPDGSGLRRFTQVTTLKYLTTSRRLTLMFVWVHALGTGALMLPEECRRPALCALACMQTIILSTQGRRSYSVNEWTRLLVDSAFEFFSAVEFLMQYAQDHSTRENPPIFTPMER